MSDGQKLDDKRRKHKSHAVREAESKGAIAAASLIRQHSDTLDARDAEIARLREVLGGLYDALGLRRDDHELRREYGKLGLDWIKRARTDLNGGSHDK
jgi:hypothetical protein